MPDIAPYGTWTSPITAADVAAAGSPPAWPALVDGRIHWAEPRPDDGGRVAIVRQTDDGSTEELLPTPWNARNRVHEYGGRPWLALDGGELVFTNWDDQRVYLKTEDGTVTALSPEPSVPQGVRFGDLRHGPDGEIWAVRESSVGARRSDVTRDLVAIGPDGSGVRTLGASHHFLTAPQPSPDGTHAAWLGWNHPSMPWDGTELCLAPVTPGGEFGPHRVIAGGPDISVCQFEWDTDDALLVLSDPDGWWNLHRVGTDGETHNLAPVTREIGGPLWKLGNRWFVPLGEGRYAVLAAGTLAILDENTGTVLDVPAASDYTAWSAITACPGGVTGVAAGPNREDALIRVDLTEGTLTEITGTEPDSATPPSTYLSTPTARTFDTADGEHIPVWLYPPTNPEFTGPDGDLPPYVVHVHGGPTGRHAGVIDHDFAYFTSRGIGIAAVNYGGSTGYGRRYRERLRENWGVVDVGDCVAVADALVAEGIADPRRLGIRGGSAGGFTSAAAMTMTRTFHAGTIKFPILDLAGWTGEGGETHDFESRYLDSLVGPMPESAQRYRDRSPLFHADSLAGPVLLLQGLEDEICPPEQADRFVESLHGKGIPHAYITFDGEQHGFRRSTTIITALESELSFYGQVFGFAPLGVDRLELRK